MLSSLVREVIQTSSPMLLVHGGAWDIPEEEHFLHREGMMQALRLGSQLIMDGVNAMKVVAKVVSSLEDHEAFDAGYGSVLNRGGFVEMDAGIMDGSTGNYGAVLGVRKIKNPIQVALRLSNFDEGQSRMLLAQGAEDFAKKESLEFIDPRLLVHPREQSRYEELKARDDYHTSQSFAGEHPKGTVGCVVLDKNGNISAGTSTGGAPYTLEGRIGDSPIPGSGYYANEHCGISCTGWGEAIVGEVLAARLADLSLKQLQSGQGGDLLNKMNQRYSSRNSSATAGYILLRADHAEFAFNTPRMARSFWSKDLGFHTKVLP